MKVTMYISVVQGTSLDAYSSHGTLWVQQRSTGFLPEPGRDSVVLWATEDEGPGGGPLWNVKRRYMDSEGGWHVELSHIVIDPVAPLRERLMRDSARGDYTMSPWWTESDGDPEQQLRTGGWRRYSEGR